MERITLSMPIDLREAVRRMAEETQLAEAEVIRELLREGLETRKREAFYAAVEAASSPELDARLTALASGMEAVRGEAG